MHDLATIKARNARAMKDADKYGMGRRPDPHSASMECGINHKPTPQQIAARDALIAAAKAIDDRWNDQTETTFFEAVAAYREAYKT